MSVIPREEERFYKNILIMSEAIYDSVQQLHQRGYSTIDPTIVSLAVNVISSFDKHYLIQGYIKNSHINCWDFIKKRDEVFFVENSSEIFKYLPMDKINLFRDLFLTKDPNGNSVVPQQLKDQLWDLLSAMTKISIKYIHRGRSPTTKPGEYLNDYFEEIDIARHAKVWGLQLEFPLTT